jgi:glycerate-2-kinase
MGSGNHFNIIKNTGNLISKGNIEGRKVALKVLECALKEVDNYELVKRVIKIEGDKLFLGENEYVLSELQDIYVLGAGKASFGIAKALEERLQERIRDGVIIEKRGRSEKLRRVRVFEAGHPIPDQAGLEGAFEVAKLAERAGEGDLVFVVVTGGCSALMPHPAEGLTLEDIMRVNRLLLESGATIDEINPIRKHLSSIKGGKLALMIRPAKIVNLIVIDEIAGRPWGPTIPDETTFADAIATLKKYNLWTVIPENALKHLERSDPEKETPKKKEFDAKGVEARTIVLAKNYDACRAALVEAKRLGYNAIILTTVLEGESKDAGVILSAVAREAEANSNPIEKPCVIISGGETTVTIVGEAGEGGRNQELALSASLKIAGSKNMVIASLGTDGTDGPTDIAGAIVDGHTADRAQEIGIDLARELKNHNSSHVFRQLGDAIYTGPTGTNVMDLQVIVVTQMTSVKTFEKE